MSTLARRAAPPGHGAGIAWGVAAALLGGALGGVLAVLPVNLLTLPFAGLGALLVLVLWAMPAPKSVPVRPLFVLLAAFTAVFCIWPSYIALRLPGLPWLSITRMVLLALVGIALYTFFNARPLRERILEHVRANPAFFACFFAFNAALFLSLAFSNDIGNSVSKLSVFQMYWTLVFFVVLAVVTTPDRVRLMVGLLVACGAAQVAIGLVESRYERLLWLDYLPPGFAAESDVLERITGGVFRGERYRVQGSFVVSLVYAEFLVLMLPFAILLAHRARTWTVRVLAFAVAALIPPATYLSGSRLGMVGSIVVILSWILLYSFGRWVRFRKSLTGPALMIMLPVMLGLFGAAVLGSNRLYTATVGGGEHQASTQGRREMFASAMPKVAARPILGYGVARASATLGVTNLAGVETIDSYVLTLLLEVGIVGFLAFTGMLLWAIVAGVRLYLSGTGPEAATGGAVAVALVAFAVIKTVLSQFDNHMLVFLMMGLLLCLKRLEVPATGVRAGQGGTAAPAMAGSRLAHAAR